jgi:hypothetical protein
MDEVLRFFEHITSRWWKRGASKMLKVWINWMQRREIVNEIKVYIYRYTVALFDLPADIYVPCS